MVVVVFRARLKPQVNLEVLGQLGQRMHELAIAMPGFISYKDYAAEDGESVSVIEFQSPETLAAWREHPEHKAVQQRARTEFFSEYRIQVCTPLRDYRFP
jgi:heme-degrading monooxygenase HmoA